MLPLSKLKKPESSTEKSENEKEGEGKGEPAKPKPLKLLKFQISFDTKKRRESLAVFFPGQIIHGWLKYEHKEELKCRGIAIIFRGQAELFWNEQSWVDAGLLKPIKPSDETKRMYFERTVHLLGQGGSMETLKPGAHSFLFEFKLPRGLPSTFIGTLGRVWYEAEAVIFSEKSMHALAKTKAHFMVDGILDLNSEPGLCEQVELRKSTTPLNLFSCCICCCRKLNGEIDFLFDISKRGFVPGEFLMGSVQLDNRSRRRVQKSIISLVQKIRYISEKRTKCEENIICSSQGPRVEAGASENWQIALKIPEDLPPSRLAIGNIHQTQQIINVDYKLHAVVHWGIGICDMKGKIPLILGSIPLRCTDDGNSYSYSYSNDHLIIETYTPDIIINET